MKKILCSLLFSFTVTVFAAAQDSAAGIWQTYDDKTHEPNGRVQIYEEDGIYYGKILGSADPHDKSPETYCQKCPTEFKDKPVRNLRFMWGFTQNRDKYTGGHILDPNTGHVYNASMQLVNEGQQLNMRGYMGISLLGSTQKWKRLE